MKSIQLINGIWTRGVPAGWIFGQRFRTTVSVDVLTNPTCRIMRFLLADGRVVDVAPGRMLTQLQNCGRLGFRLYQGTERFESPCFSVDARTGNVLA